VAQQLLHECRVAKRGPGRPRKHPLPTDSNTPRDHRDKLKAKAVQLKVKAGGTKVRV